MKTLKQRKFLFKASNKNFHDYPVHFRINEKQFFSIYPPTLYRLDPIHLQSNSSKCFFNFFFFESNPSVRSSNPSKNKHVTLDPGLSDDDGKTETPDAEHHDLKLASYWCSFNNRGSSTLLAKNA